jgi:hypothetical protein
VFIGETSGKFTDPLNAKGKITQNELSELVAYVDKLQKKINEKIVNNIGKYKGPFFLTFSDNTVK